MFGTHRTKRRRLGFSGNHRNIIKLRNDTLDRQGVDDIPAIEINNVESTTWLHFAIGKALIEGETRKRLVVAWLGQTHDCEFDKPRK